MKATFAFAVIASPGEPTSANPQPDAILPHMAIQIAGAAGFVAFNVIEHLLTAGRDMVGLDRIALPAR
jgi:hypothetical protein